VLLQDLPERLGATSPLLIPSAAPTWPAGFAAVPPDADPATLGLDRVLLAGGYEGRAEFDRLLGLAARAVASGARLEVRRFALEGGTVRVEAPPDIGVLDAAPAIELRDHATADALLVWGVAAPLRLAAYPERAGPSDDALARELPAGPLLGVAVLGEPELRDALQAHLPALRARLAPFRGVPVVPLPAEAPGAPLDDLPGSLAFAEAVLPESPVMLPDLADPAWRRRHLTVPAMRGLVARCAVVVASQDLPAAMAVGAGIPLLGLAPGGNRRIVTCMATLANALPEGSDLLVLRRPG
jgi:hypothetical protein